MIMHNELAQLQEEVVTAYIVKTAAAQADIQTGYLTNSS
jgi:hypothetical protein